MKTPIIDHASLHTDAFDSPAKARAFAGKLELDRASLMGALDRLVYEFEYQANHGGFDESRVEFIQAKTALAAARANFPDAE